MCCRALVLSASGQYVGALQAEAFIKQANHKRGEKPADRDNRLLKKALVLADISPDFPVGVCEDFETCGLDQPRGRVAS